MIRLKAPGIEADRDVIGEDVVAGERKVDQSRQFFAEEEHVVRKQVAVDDAERKVRRPARFEIVQLARDEIGKARLHAVGAIGCTLEQRPPAGDRQWIGAHKRKVAAGQMHLCERSADAGAMRGVRPARPHAFEKIDDRRRPAREFAIDRAAAVLRRLRATDAALGQMRHQRQEIRQVVRRHALLIKREDVGALAGVHQKIGILDALGDALVGEQFADVVAFRNSASSSAATSV